MCGQHHPLESPVVDGAVACAWTTVCVGGPFHHFAGDMYTDELAPLGSETLALDLNHRPLSTLITMKLFSLIETPKVFKLFSRTLNRKRLQGLSLKPNLTVFTIIQKPF